MDPAKEDDSSGPSSLSSDQASLCVIPDPDDSSEEDGFIYLDKSSLPASLNGPEHDRAIIVFHSVDEEYPANQDIICQYIRPDGWDESLLDNICLFKVGWVTKNDAIFMVPPAITSNDPVGCVIIPERILPKDTINLYQFCYMREYTLLGASTPFQFTFPDENPQHPEVNQMSHARTSDGSCSEETNVLKDTHILPCNFDMSTKIDNIKSSMEMEQFSMIGGIEESKIQWCNENSLLLDSSSSAASRNGLDWWARGFSTASANDSSLMERSDVNLQTDSNIHFKGTEKTTSEKATLCDDLMSSSNISEKKNEFTTQTSKDEVSELKSLLNEVKEENQWFQEQYNSLLITAKKVAEDLASERIEKESVNGHLTELAKSHKMLCSENIQLNSELEALKQTFKEQSEKWMQEKEKMEKQFKDVSSDNTQLKQTVDHLQSQVKMEQKSHIPSECKQCEKYRSQIEDLTAHLSDFDIMRNCMEVELEEEMKLGKERDLYVAQLEQVKVHNLQMSNNLLASTPTSVANGNVLLEMEENVNSTLEALECALKEMEVLRSRKVAVNKANRVLREEFIQKRAQWEERLIKQRSEFDVQLNDLRKQLESGNSSKIDLMKEIENLREQLRIEAVQKQSLQVSQPENISGAEITKKEIEALLKKKSDLEKESSLLKKKFQKLEVKEDMNHTLLRNLEEAREEYKKLYAEKMRVQGKLSRLQQKVKSKKGSRAPQEGAPSTSKADFMDNVCVKLHLEQTSSKVDGTNVTYFSVVGTKDLIPADNNYIALNNKQNFMRALNGFFHS